MSVSDIILKISNIESYYGPIMAIRGISLEVPRGSIVTLLGANGAGKSTLLKAIVGLLPRSAGAVELDGKPLPNDELPASVLLPMGRTGPAFLAYENFAAYTEWNNSLIYATTAGYLAARIAGAPPMRQPAQPVAQLQFAEIKELQNLLVRAGFNVGKVDGVLGQQSRVAVKAMQQKYGLPADSWPTAELLTRMRGPGAQALPSGAVMQAR